MTARLSPQRQAQIVAELAAYQESHDHPAAFACCSAHAVADAVPELLAEIDRLRNETERRAAESETEWGTRENDGGYVARHHSRQRAVEDLQGLRALGVAAALVRRSVHHGEWREANDD